MMTFKSLWRGVRDADWLDAGRAVAYRRLLLAVMLGIALLWALSARQGIDASGKPLGTDFLAFWSASKLALSGAGASSYVPASIHAVERAAMPVDPGLSTFLYPPPFLLLCLPLALAPYALSLLLWLAATGAAFAAVMRRWLGPLSGKGWTLLAFPAVIVNIGHGQNGFLTTALLGSGLWLMQRRPALAGALLGALVIKPQIALAVPILVLASGRWRVMAGGIASAAILCAASWLVLGPEPWRGFFAGQSIGRAILEQGLVEPGKMVSVFAAFRVIGAGTGAAYAAQAACACISVLLLAVTCRRNPADVRAQAAATVAATPLLSPFLLDYDLVLIAIPLVWLLGEGLRRGFRPYEKIALAAGFVLPLIARPLALALRVPIAPLCLIALLVLITRAASGATAPMLSKTERVPLIPARA